MNKYIFTSKDCKKWQENKLYNPQTNRKIKEESPIYKKLNKLCSNNKIDIYSIFNNFCQTYKLKSSDIINSKDKKIYQKFNSFCDSIIEDFKDNDSKDDIKKDKKNKDDIKDIKKNKDDIKDIKKNKDDIKDNKDDIKKDKKNKDDIKDIKKENDLRKSYSLISDKFDDYIKLIKYFKNIKLNSKNCITLTEDDNKYFLTDNIKLYQQIGSPSIYGIVYKAANINKDYNSIPKFIVKIQLQSEESKRELDIYKKLSAYAIENKIIHIPLYYFNCTCNTIIKEQEYPIILKQAKKNFKYYSMILYERALGDLSYFIKTYNSNIEENVWKNIYEQLYISLFILHNLNYLHADAHLGNFLYYKIKKGGCFHYKIDNEDYYIENLGFLWMIWDFGHVRLVNKLVSYAFLDDYYRVNISLSHRNKELEKNKEFQNNILAMAFQDKDKNNISGFFQDNIVIPKSIKNIQEKLWEKFVNINPDKYITIKAATKKIDSKSFIKLLKDENILFSKSPIGEIISSVNLT
jgi:hypothetical protein